MKALLMAYLLIMDKHRKYTVWLSRFYSRYITERITYGENNGGRLESRKKLL